MFKSNNKIFKSLKIYLILVGIIAPILFSILLGYFITGKRTDFCQDYTSAYLITHQQSPYQEIHCWEILPPFNKEYNPHPPFSILLFYPLLNFDSMTAGRIWSFLSIIFYFSGILILLKIIRWFTPAKIAIFFFINLLWLPYHLAVAYQNIIQLIFLLLVLAWYFKIKNKDKLAGILLGIATLLRFWPFLAVLPFLLTKKKTVVATTIATIFLGLITTLLFGFGPYYAEYFSHVANFEDIYVLHINNISFISLIAKILYTNNAGFQNSILIAKIAGITVFTSILTYLFIKVYKYINKLTILNLCFAVCLTLLPFIFPVLWEWVLIIYLLPYIIIFKTVEEAALKHKVINRILIFSIIMLSLMRFVAYISYPGERLSLDVDYPSFLIFHNYLLVIGIASLLFTEFKIINLLINKSKNRLR